MSARHHADALQKAGVRYFRYHALRHFGASQLEMRTCRSDRSSASWARNRTTTELYLHSIGNAERQAIDVLDGNFAENPTQIPHKSKGATDLNL